MPTFADITSSINGASPFSRPFDCLLIGFGADQLVSNPPDSIDFTFSTPASANCSLIAEYSAGDGVWRALAFNDTVDGGMVSGTLHFTPPADWAATNHWDATTHIGDGSSTLYWIRIQRRNKESVTAPTLGSIAATNRPYLVAKRTDGVLARRYTAGDVGHVASFRFVPVGQDGREAKAVQFDYTIG